MAYGMIIDLKRCVNCRGCATACKSANGTPPGVTRARVLRREVGEYPNVKRTILPMLCMQCEDPACLAVCPAGATKKRDDGIVIIDKDECVGCQACVTACPYGARYYRDSDNGYFGSTLTPYEQVKYKNMPKGVVDKCDFCLEKIQRGEKPACVAICTAEARTFGTMEELEPIIAERGAYQLLPELGLGPHVYYVD